MTKQYKEFMTEVEKKVRNLVAKVQAKDGMGNTYFVSLFDDGVIRHWNQRNIALSLSNLTFNDTAPDGYAEKEKRLRGQIRKCKNATDLAAVLHRATRYDWKEAV